MSDLAKQAAETSWEIACKWYTPDEVHRSIQFQHAVPGALPPIPADVNSREFTEWLTDQYRLAMNKGIQLGRDGHAAATGERDREIAELKAEVERLFHCNLHGESANQPNPKGA